MNIKCFKTAEYSMDWAEEKGEGSKKKREIDLCKSALQSLAKYFLPLPVLVVKQQKCKQTWIPLHFFVVALVCFYCSHSSFPSYLLLFFTAHTVFHLLFTSFHLLNNIAMNVCYCLFLPTSSSLLPPPLFLPPLPFPHSFSPFFWNYFKILFI